MIRCTMLAVSLAGVGCAASTTTTAPSASSPTSTPRPSATPAVGTSGGFGDTAINPDTQYICAAQATESGQVIAYTTIAGPDASGGQGVCTAMEQGSQGAWSDVASISGGTFATAPICWITAGNGQVTQRVYTALPHGTDSLTKLLCDDLFTGAGVTPPGSG